jgi:hypothetical protein
MYLSKKTHFFSENRKKKTTSNLYSFQTMKMQIYEKFYDIKELILRTFFFGKCYLPVPPVFTETQKLTTTRFSNTLINYINSYDCLVCAISRYGKLLQDTR